MAAHDLKMTPEMWVDARKLHEQTGASFSDIGRSFGVTKGLIGRRAKDEGWVKGERPPATPAIVHRIADRPPVVKLYEREPRKREVLDQNEEAILRMIAEGDNYALISKKFNCSVSTFGIWIDASDERSKAVARAMQHASFKFIQQAEDVLIDAKTNVEVTRARELANHLRWKARAYNPRVFGDKQQIEMTGTVRTEASSAEVDKRLAELLNVVDVDTKLLP